MGHTGGMYRRVALLFLAMLVALPVVAPATATEPAATPAVVPPVAPAPTPVTTPTPSPDPARPRRRPTARRPAVDPAPAVTTPDTTQTGALDATGRYIVMLRAGSDTAAVVDKVHKRDGVKADRSFSKAFRGFSAKLDEHQKRDLLADPNVDALVPGRGRPHAPRRPSRPASRASADSSTRSPTIDGNDTRVDADVAIVDTGITARPGSERRRRPQLRDIGPQRLA